jgi:hypothetical protein
LPHHNLLCLPLAGHTGVFPNANNFAQHSLEHGPLLVFLPATGARPIDYRSFLTAAVAQGYHVLGLDYWNRGASVTRTCGLDAQCYTDVQQNRLTGLHPTKFSDVGVANSITARLRMALAWLTIHDKTGEWQRYLTGTAINWGTIVMAGHSQGGGESAYISHLHSLKGALMFSSPVETDGSVSAAWMTSAGQASAGATPASRMYGFVSSGDVFLPKIIGSWSKLGMGSGSMPISGSVPTGAHTLVSTVALGGPDESHLRSVQDSTVRNAEGVPIFLPTWNWMLAQVR